MIESITFNPMQVSLLVNGGETSPISPAMSLADRIKEVRKRAKLTQEQFAAEIGRIAGEPITRGGIGNWELGGGIERKFLKAVAKFGDVTLDWLDGTGTPHREENKQNINRPSPFVGVVSDSLPRGDRPTGNARFGGPVMEFARVPVRGQGMGGKSGTLIFSAGEQNMGEVLAPPSLANVTGAYACYVVGDSMLDKFRHGDIVFVHPFMPVLKGDDCVVQFDVKGERHGLIKRFVSRDDRRLKLLQLHPKKTIILPMASVYAVHKIVMSGPP